MRLGNPEIVKLILAEGLPLVIDVTGENGVRDYYAGTLASAISTKNPEIVKLILAEGAPLVIAAEDEWGPRNTLAWAIESGNPEIVELILAAGALIVTNATKFGGSKRDYHADTLALAIKSGNPEIVELILKKGAPIVDVAILAIKWPFVRQCDVSSLALAMGKGNQQIVDLLLIYGADPAVLQGEFKGFTKGGLLARRDELKPQILAKREELMELRERDRCSAAPVTISTLPSMQIFSPSQSSQPSPSPAIVMSSNRAENLPKSERGR